MEETNSQDNRSPQEREIDRIVNEANQRVAVINHSIKNLPADKPLSYELRPPGEFPSRPAGSKKAKEKALHQQLSDIRSTTKDEIAAVLKTLPLEAQLKLYQKAHQRDHSERDRKEMDILSEKDMDASQEIAMELLSNRLPAEEKEEVPNPSAGITPPLFSSTFKNAGAFGTTDPSPDTSPTPEINSDPELSIEPE